MDFQLPPLFYDSKFTHNGFRVGDVALGCPYSLWDGKAKLHRFYLWIAIHISTISKPKLFKYAMAS
jgi:hypothetical protein